MSGVDIVVIGGGIAGVSAAAMLSHTHSVALVEAEQSLAHHTTGRSAAQYLENIGTLAVRGLTLASRPYFVSPPEGLADAPLLEPRALLSFGRDHELESLHALAASGASLVPSVRFVDAPETLELCSAIRPAGLAGAVYEPDSMSIDVMAVHQSFVRDLRRNGGTIHRDAGVTGLEWSRDGWDVATTQGPFRATTVVNASGAWADEIALMAGVRPIGIMPLRRTAFTSKPTQFDEQWPLVAAMDHSFYCKPEAGGFVLCSPMDEIPSDPCDAVAEELDVAMAIDTINAAMDLGIRSVHTAWAGLRSFVEDRNPVLGFDDEVPGFFWCVGQGGAGIQTSPASGDVVAALIAGLPLPQALLDRGLEASQLAPGRLSSREISYGRSPVPDH